MRCSSAPGRIRHFASGLRRQAPEPLQGASIEDEVAAAGEIGQDVAAPLGRAHLHVAGARALEAVEDRTDGAPSESVA